MVCHERRALWRVLTVTEQDGFDIHSVVQDVKDVDQSTGRLNACFVVHTAACHNGLTGHL